MKDDEAYIMFFFITENGIDETPDDVSFPLAGRSINRFKLPNRFTVYAYNGVELRNRLYLGDWDVARLFWSSTTTRLRVDDSAIHNICLYMTSK